jgi:hypothetical protein
LNWPKVLLLLEYPRFVKAWQGFYFEEGSISRLLC